MPKALSQEELESLRQVCGQVAAKQAKLLAAFPDLSADDLAQECVITCLRRAPKFDPAKSAWRSWCWRTASSRCIDIYRSRTTLARTPDPAYITESVANCDASENRSMGSILGSSMEAAEHGWTLYSRRGPHRYTRPQLAAVVALRHHLRLSYRSLHMALTSSGELRRELQLRTVPDPMTILRAERNLGAMYEHSAHSAH